MSTRTLWLTCATLAALGLAAELAKPATPDMGFLLYAAGRVLDGARLYRDIVEINPPLIVALNIPIVLLARATGAPEFVLYRLGSAVFVGLLLLYASRLVFRYVLPAEPPRARYLVLLLCFGLFALPRVDFGQREHFVLALLIPYLLLVVAEGEGRRPPSAEAAVIGVMAGAAVGLKPHFALVWTALECFRRVHAPPAERWQATPELAGFLGFLAVYGCAVLWLTPDYLPMAFLLGPAYVRYMREPFLHLLVLGPGAPLVGFALLALLGLRRHVRTPKLAAVLAWATAACFLAGAAQEKGFRYHFYPALALAFVLLGLIAADAKHAVQRMSERLYGWASRSLLAAISVVVIGWATLDATGTDPVVRRQRAELDNLVASVRARAAGRPIGVLSYTIASAFPLVNYADVRLASRFPHLWPLAASYWNAIDTGVPLRYHAVAHMPPVERYFLNAVREDLTTAQPRLLLVLRPARDVPKNGLRRLHYVEYLDRDPELAAFLSDYRLAERQGEYLLYERRGAKEDATGPPPSPAPGTQDVIRPELKDVRLGQLDPESVIGLAVLGVCWVLVAMADRRGGRA